MKIYAIGDLHLDFKGEKPMSVFGPQWENHMFKIQKHWIENVEDHDIVLIPGDISWAMRLDEAREDLDFIRALPGRKICIKGNHDYWWQKITYLNTLYKEIDFIQNNSIVIDDIGFCGTRGWLCPNTSHFTQEDYKIYERESLRLKLSLEDAVSKGAQKLIVMLHYPPTNDKQEPSLFTQMLKQYKVHHVVYGHLHDPLSYEAGLKGIYEGTQYDLVSADYLDFKPKLIYRP